MISLTEIFLILLLLICIACTITLCTAIVSEIESMVAKNEQIEGGAPHRQTTRPKKQTKSGHLIIDTLNLVHWLRKSKQANAPVTTAEILLAIDRTAPQLRRRYSGTLVYVLKDQESQLNSSETRAQYQEAAERNRVHIACAERSDFAALGARSASAQTNLQASAQANLQASAQASHSALGRDDFYMCLQADRYQCAVATCDRLRDFAEFRNKVAPFHTVTFVYWRATPERDFIRPASPAYARLRKPQTIEFSDLLK